MQRMFTALYEQCEGGGGAGAGVPRANTQGKTRDEARANLTEAVAMILAERRKFRETEGGGIVA